MKTRLIYFIMISSIIVFISSCQSNRNKKAANLAPNAHEVTAQEVIQTSSYTYVRVLSDGRDYWIAINKMEVKEGETYYWSIGTPMKDFASKELKRTFPVIFFIQDFTDKPITLYDQMAASPVPGSFEMQGSPMAGKQQAPEKPGITIQKAKGGVTIAELYSKRNSFAGKTVIIRGEVIKYSPGIMYKNWVHVQDGTKDAGNYDLTVTTMDTVKVGEVVDFKGMISLDKDFSAGYTYDIIMEDAKKIAK